MMLRGLSRSKRERNEKQGDIGCETNHSGSYGSRYDGDDDDVGGRWFGDGAGTKRRRA